MYSYASSRIHIYDQLFLFYFYFFLFRIPVVTCLNCFQVAAPNFLMITYWWFLCPLFWEPPQAWYHPSVCPWPDAYSHIGLIAICGLIRSFNVWRVWARGMFLFLTTYLLLLYVFSLGFRFHSLASSLLFSFFFGGKKVGSLRFKNYTIC